MKNEEKRMGIKIKTIAVLLVFVMVFNLFPQIVFAVISEVRNSSVKEPPVITEEKEVKILREDISKRTANYKYFEMEDGTEMVAMYESPVHYEKDGKLEEINNELEETEDNGEMLLEEIEEVEEINEEEIQEIKEERLNVRNNSKIQSIEEYNKERKRLEKEVRRKQEIYENKSNAFDVKFVKEAKNNNLVSIKNDGYQMKWSVKNANKSKIELLNKEGNTKLTGNAKKVNMRNLSSSVIYKDILDDIDIKYDTLAEGVKESIILKNRDAINTNIVFEYRVGNLKMELNDNKEIIVFNEEKGKDEPEFIMESLFMYDRQIVTSAEIDVKLEEKEDKYILTIIPSREWLEDKDRQYPVVIDPTVNTSLNYQEIQDTFIYDGDQGSTERYRAHIIRVGSNKYTKHPTRGLIKFNLPELNPGDQVVNAILDICNYPDTYEWTPTTNEIQIDVHKVTTSWNQETANWNNMNANYNPKIEDYIIYKYDNNNPFKFNYFNITSIVKDWYTTGNNNGLMLKDHIETYNYNQSDAYFLSANTHVEYAQGRPMVQITYRNQKGLEEYLSYHTQEMGRAGTGYTNDYNGNLVLIHEDINTPGERLPVSINHVFNTANKDEDIGFGYGYRLNTSQLLSEQTIQGAEYLRYIDADATNIYLKKEGNKYLDEDGKGLIAQKVNNSMVLTDKEGNKLTFEPPPGGINGNWFLKQIEDTNGNKIQIVFNGSANPVTITDAAGKVLSFTYSNGRLSRISDTNNRSIGYTYNGTGNLTQITYLDGNTSKYTYHENLLTSAKNIDGTYI